MNSKRLLKLADFLDTVPRKRFNLGLWQQYGFKPKAESACGTVACAMGWACTIPSFKRAGLKAHKDDRYPIFENQEGFSAAAKFFDISFPQAERLFSSSGYGNRFNSDAVTPKKVAKAIRNFVKDYTL